MKSDRVFLFSVIPFHKKNIIDFTLSNARRFYSSMGKPLDGKGLSSEKA